jgi:hypothetical protein
MAMLPGLPRAPWRGLLFMDVISIRWSWIMRQFLYNVRRMGLSDTLRCELRNLALILRLTKNIHIRDSAACPK